MSANLQKLVDMWYINTITGGSLWLVHVLWECLTYKDSRDALMVKLETCKESASRTFIQWALKSFVLVCEVWEKGYCMEFQTLLSLDVSPQL